MGSVQENPKLGAGEKAVNVVGRVIITCLLPVVWLIRRFKKKQP